MMNVFSLHGFGWTRILLWAAMTLAVPQAWSDESCDSQHGVEFVCGPVNGEDLVWLPGTDLIVVSGMSDEGEGHLYLLDPDSREVEEWYPGQTPTHRWDKATFTACPGPLNTGNFSAHGLSMLRGNDSVHRLYVTSHGEREAVEVFEVNTAGESPSVVWVGCVLIPDHNSINSVAALRDGGFITTRISGTGSDSVSEILSGDISGFLYEWHPGGELMRLPGTDMSAPNGIVISEDEQWVYVGSWGRKGVARYKRGETGELQKDRTLSTGFRVDNLRWTTAGTLLATGHRLSQQTDCGAPVCFEEWEVAELDADLEAKHTLIVKAPVQGFMGATVALGDKSGKGLWMGTFRGDRLAYAKRSTH